MKYTFKEILEEAASRQEALQKSVFKRMVTEFFEVVVQHMNNGPPKDVFIPRLGSFRINVGLVLAKINENLAYAEEGRFNKTFIRDMPFLREVLQTRKLRGTTNEKYTEKLRRIEELHAEWRRSSDRA